VVVFWESAFGVATASAAACLLTGCLLDLGGASIGSAFKPPGLG
jgi:hypothetical protein